MKLIDILDATPIPVGYRLAFLTNFWREPLLRRMERDHGIIRPELTVLMCLSFRGRLNARDICEITEQPSNTVSRAVGSLAQHGLIARRRDTVDTRRVVLDITETGQALHDAILATFAEAEEQMLTGLDAQEVAVLTGLLDRIARNVDDWSPATGAQRRRAVRAEGG